LQGLDTVLPYLRGERLPNTQLSAEAILKFELVALKIAQRCNIQHMVAKNTRTNQEMR